MLSLDSLIGNNLVNTICEYLLLIVVLINYKSLFVEKPKLRNGFFLLWLFLTVFSMFYSPEGGDSFTSIDAYDDFSATSDGSNQHFEPVYLAIMSLVGQGYVIWRFVIWGAAAAIMVAILKKCNADSRIALFFWAYLGWQAFYYQRISLAMALLFWGVMIIISARDNSRSGTFNLKIFAALLIIVASYFFHRSMPIYFIVSALVLLMPTKKWSVIVLLIGVPLILPVVVNLVGTFLQGASDDLQDWGEIYMSTSNLRGEEGLNSFLYRMFRWLPYAFIVVYSVIDLVNHPDSYSEIERYFLLFGAVLYALSFFLQGMVADSVGGKMKIQSVMSMTMFLSLYYTNHKDSIQGRIYAKAAIVTFVVIFIYEHFL